MRHTARETGGFLQLPGGPTHVQVLIYISQGHVLLVLCVLRSEGTSLCLMKTTHVRMIFFSGGGGQRRTNNPYPEPELDLCRLLVGTE